MASTSITGEAKAAYGGSTSVDAKNLMARLQAGSPTRSIRPLPRRKDIQPPPSSSPPIQFASDQNLNTMRFAFPTPPSAPSFSRLPVPAVPKTMTVLEIQKYLPRMDSKDKAAATTEQKAAQNIDSVKIDKTSEPDNEKQDDLEAFAEMEVKKDENPSLMFLDLPPVPNDLGKVTGLSAEVEELMKTIRTLEEEKSDLAEELRRPEEQLAAARKARLDCAEEVSLSQPDTAEKNSDKISESQSNPSLLSSPEQPTYLPTCVRKKLFNSQLFKAEDLPKERDAEFMADILQSLAEEFDAAENVESQPQPQAEPSPPLTRTAWRAQNGLKPKPTPYEPICKYSTSIFNYTKILGLIFSLLVFRSFWFPFEGYSFDFDLRAPFFTTTATSLNPYDLTTSIANFINITEAVYNEPTCLTWSNGSSELNDMITCFACDEPVPEPPFVPEIEEEEEEKEEKEEQYEIVYKHDPLYPVQKAMWVGYQWTQPAWRRSNLYGYLFSSCDEDLVFVC
ncbi:hypothetical protein ONS95_007445 [Cadophora gregata]|uniref:uncharacterized protein n=1 Tax=Cadophora gregata TaxID=51156 RepID=UPI0026DC66F6|nr:uncharacterized protein ONS95_007445 [Cadophora gregata]KAK0118558.1 hypothetical protein ONS96_011651 [Cadophora gregata f. sp. sojae]KAK0125813.1 hypothetical protein ONS95_007445 [Cadophora gregata]